ncbi:MAG: TetR/AcrR family transcriptional regulator [Acidobacteriota bacterium]
MNETNVRSTPGKILDAAEQLFARQGIEATSLRQITSEAGVNLAAVNYHFNSKDALVKLVYLRRVRPMNAMRLERLRQAEEAKPGDLDAVLEAYYGPVLDLAEVVNIGLFLGRLYTEPHGVACEVLAEEMGETARRFAQALGRILPHLSAREIFLRLNFSAGVIAHTIGAREKLGWMSQGLADMGDKQQLLREMKQYANAGLMAPGLEQRT